MDYTKQTAELFRKFAVQPKEATVFDVYAKDIIEKLKGDCLALRMSAESFKNFTINIPKRKLDMKGKNFDDEMREVFGANPTVEMINFLNSDKAIIASFNKSMDYNNLLIQRNDLITELAKRDDDIVTLRVELANMRVEYEKAKSELTNRRLAQQSVSLVDTSVAGLTLDAYQELSEKTAVYDIGISKILPNGFFNPAPHKPFETRLTLNLEKCLFLSYLALGLNGESGEVAELIKKMIRDDNGVLLAERREKLIKEMGDVLWYLSQLCTKCDISFGFVARENLNKLAKRKMENKLGGDGSDR